MCGGLIQTKGGRVRRPAGSPGLTDELRATAARWAFSSARAQGLPERVTDGTVLRQVAVLLGCSDAPDRSQPARIKPVEATASGSHENVIQDGGNDRMLPAQRKRRPRPAKLRGL